MTLKERYSQLEEIFNIFHPTYISIDGTYLPGIRPMLIVSQPTPFNPDDMTCFFVEPAKHNRKIFGDVERGA